MQLIVSWPLLVSGFVLFPATLAGVTPISANFLEQLKIQHDVPEVPLQIIEHEISLDVKNEASLQEFPEIPPEVEETLQLEQHSFSGECLINIRSGLADPQPLFLKTGKEEFYPYSEAGHIQVAAGKSLQMFCSGQFKSFAKTLITATCVNGNIFRVDGSSYQFAEFVCKSWPNFVVKKTGRPCNGGSLLQVGFQIDATRFVEQMQVCFSEQEEVTRYVYHELQPGSNFYQTSVVRITFQTNGFFGGKNVDKLYTQKTQLDIINADLQGEGEKYFNSSKNLYLARGHLAAKADMMYGSQQRATFSYLNAAPQWQVFNAGNWVRIEDGLRAWVTKNRMHVQCYTGVWGVTTLPNKYGQETPLYLARDNNNNGLIPVPKLYFRVVIEAKSKKGIVFIGVNNPHLSFEQIQRDYVICKDISDEVNYIKWKKTDIIAGYSYACEVGDFVNSVKELPELKAEGGLLV